METLTMCVDGVVVFNGDSGLSLRVVSDRLADGTRELEGVIASIELYYGQLYSGSSNKANIPREPWKQEGDTRLYKVLAGTRGYLGTVKVIPKGMAPKFRLDHNEDFPISDGTVYTETYWLFFFPQDKQERRKHRDGYVDLIDPREMKTRRR